MTVNNLSVKSSKYIQRNSYHTSIEWYYSWHNYHPYHHTHIHIMLIAFISILILLFYLSWCDGCILEEYSRLPTARRIDSLPTLRDTFPTAATTGYSTAAAICHDIDIEGVVEERVVEGDDELYIQRYPCHILIFNITYHDVMDVS